MNPLVDAIAHAIATMEGFYVPGSLAQRNNNPGNLRNWGSLPTNSGYAVFPTVEQGWAALKRQVKLNIGRGLNLYEFFGGKPGTYAGYAPAADNNRPNQYAEFVAGRVGIDPTEPLTKFSQGGTPPPPPPSGRCPFCRSQVAPRKPAQGAQW
ncbi:MAG: hypothetical protein ACK5AZ_12425 [Bryobacteraceae bacterium]